MNANDNRQAVGDVPSRIGSGPLYASAVALLVLGYAYLPLLYGDYGLRISPWALWIVTCMIYLSGLLRAGMQEPCRPAWHGFIRSKSVRAWAVMNVAYGGGRFIQTETMADPTGERTWSELECTLHIVLLALGGLAVLVLSRWWLNRRSTA